jgi:protein-disulfide isomerase
MFLLTFAAGAALAVGACGDKKGRPEQASAAATCQASPAPKAPQNGDWSTVVAQTEQCGFRMGSPDAKVKLVEFASFTCPHCREFEEQGMQPLIDKYVKNGQVSIEFRNFIRDPFDLAASLIARCGGPERFYPLARALFADQANWVGKLNNVPQEQLANLQSLPPTQQFLEIAKLAGLQLWAAQRGLPSAQSTQCLSNETEVNRLVQMNSDAMSNYNIPGTPTFLIDNMVVEQTANWATLEPKVQAALN